MPPGEITWYLSLKEYYKKMVRVDFIEVWHLTLWKLRPPLVLAMSCTNIWEWALELYNSRRID